MPNIKQKQTVDYFEAMNPNFEELGSYFANTTPIMLAAKQIRKSQQPMAANGVGQVDNLGTGALVLGIAIIGVAGALSYQAGKAMAPTKQAQTSWGIVGIPMGLFLPLGMGLGIMGVISNNQKR